MPNILRLEKSSYVLYRLVTQAGGFLNVCEGVMTLADTINNNRRDFYGWWVVGGW